MSAHGAQREAAQGFRETLINLLAQYGPLSVKALVELTGSPPSTIRDYMGKLDEDGRVLTEKVTGAAHSTGGTRTALYSLPGSEITGKCADVIQMIRTTYPLNHKRDFLVSALFGSVNFGGDI